MKRRLFVVIVASMLALIISSSVVTAGGSATQFHSAFEVFPGTAYDSPFTHSYAGAHGTVVVPQGNGNNPSCVINVEGLHPNSDYMVYSDTDGIVAGNVSTAGPFIMLGQFVTNDGGRGQFQCVQPLAPGSSVFINDSATDGTILISDNIRGQ